MRRNTPSAKQSCRRLALIGRVLLIVSLWNAPLPMVHTHGADLVDSADASVFVEHLAEYHPDVRPNSHVEFGWHWHLVPPVENHPGTDCPNGHHPCCPLDGCHSVVITSSQTGLEFAAFQTLPPWMSEAESIVSFDLDRVPVTSTRFLETYLGSVSLGTLLRVARC